MVNVMRYGGLIIFIEENVEDFHILALFHDLSTEHLVGDISRLAQL